VVSLSPSNHFLQLLLGIFVMSSSGVLGKYITLPPPTIIWIRCVIACIALYIFFRLTNRPAPFITGRTRLTIIISGILLASHWTTYFYALQYSTVAIGMLSLFTYPVISILIEPVFLKTKFLWHHLPVSLIAFFGVYLLIPEFSLENEYTVGILFGFSSSLLYAFRNILLKQKIRELSGEVLMYYQMMTVVSIMWPALFLVSGSNWQSELTINWHSLLILGVFTSAFGHSLFVRSMAHFSVSTISILSNLTPLFGILLGLIFLNEVPEGNVVAGGCCILLTAMIEVWMHGRK